MHEMLILYFFVIVMALNLLGSFIYVVGLQQLRVSLRKAFQSYMHK